MANCFGCENSTPNGECYIGAIERCPKLRDYLFIDNESGEQFFVECRTLAGAWTTVWENFGDDADVEYIDEYSVEEAEIIGLDTL